MFILRKFLGEEMVESNTILGDSYNIVYRVTNPVEFQRAFETIYGTNDDGKSNGSDVAAILIYADGSKTMPLYKGQTSYIMTQNGATFSGKLSK